MILLKAYGKLKFYRVIGTLFFLLLSFENMAQKAVYLKGRIDNLQDVNVLVKGTNYGTVSNEKGEYGLLIYLFEPSVHIQFSRIGYQDTIIHLQKNSIKSDSIEINLSLKEKLYPLEEVSISAQADFFRLPYTIADMEFINTDLILLTLKKQQSELIVLNEDGELLLKYGLIDKYDRIHIDCFGHLELIGEDSCLQVYFDRSDTSIHEIHKFSSKEFNEKLAPCILELNGHLVFSSSVLQKNKLFVDKYHQKKIDYFYTDKKDGKIERTLLHSFFDEEAFQVAQATYNEIISTYYRTTPDFENIIELGAWNGNLLKLINNDNQLFYLIVWYQKIESKPINVELFKSKGNLLLFNLSEEQIIRFNQNMESLGEVFLSSKPHNLRKLKSIIQDRKTEDIYGLFILNGRYKVAKINSSTGEFSELISSSPSSFPDVFKLNNKYAYSVYYDPVQRVNKINRRLIDTP